jgi:hypothetical protein
MCPRPSSPCRQYYAVNNGAQKVCKMQLLGNSQFQLPDERRCLFLVFTRQYLPCSNTAWKLLLWYRAIKSLEILGVLGEWNSRFLRCLVEAHLAFNVAILVPYSAVGFIPMDRSSNAAYVVVFYHAIRFAQHFDLHKAVNTLDVKVINQSSCSLIGPSTSAITSICEVAGIGNLVSLTLCRVGLSLPRDKNHHTPILI